MPEHPKLAGQAGAVASSPEATTSCGYTNDRPPVAAEAAAQAQAQAQAKGEPVSRDKGAHAGDEEDDEDDDEEWESSEEEYSECSDDDCCRRGADAEQEEARHFLDVCWSCMDYLSDIEREIEDMREMLRMMDDPLDKALWRGAAGDWIDQITLRGKHNQEFLKLLPSAEVCGSDLGPSPDRTVREKPESHRVASRNASKVRSTLRQFVRDWAVEGEAERASCYAPLVEALAKRMPPNSKGKKLVTVLCPGCGLGRLPFDLVRLGYAAQGNEFSYHMLLGSHLVLNRIPKALSFSIFPFIMSTTNRVKSTDHLREVRIPDVCPRTALPPNAALSMAAGEFVEVYKEQLNEWDSVLTAFFLDTAKNVFLYVRTIASIIRKGGLWINLGPLLFHYAALESEVSIELSWEEIRPFICKYFTITEETRRDCRYATNTGSLLSVTYRCVFFVAERNGEKVTGESSPVF
eukprot:gnl/TRDRNA2_/TRDRNA2_193830_c0_seq1.p1 gnl/TRDRNA2_/TRDRNA2_193830_c0~~gnl/TRDRNA2_/TRDRNA2_193830_c0_seq1.p1  ORF type:complete len:463 (+),score=96.64 gnl/TRDRNA2_/TRDRNA2_193830_c0_seq1:72-1460(+)